MERKRESFRKEGRILPRLGKVGEGGSCEMQQDWMDDSLKNDERPAQEKRRKEEEQGRGARRMLRDVAAFDKMRAIRDIAQMTFAQCPPRYLREIRVLQLAFATIFPFSLPVLLSPFLPLSYRHTSCDRFSQ